MFCPKCGTQNVDEALFCASCGAELPRRSQPSEPAAPYAPASPSAPSQTRTVAPGTAGRARKRSKLPFIIGGVVVLVAAIAVAAVFLVPRLLGNDGATDEDAANTTMLSGGYMASDGGYDYFYSSVRNAICRAKPGDDPVEELVTFEMIDRDGYQMPEAYVMGIAASDGYLYYLTWSYDTDGTSVQELRCCATDGSDDHLTFSCDQSSSNSNDERHSVGRFYSYDGRVYYTVYAYGDDWGDTKCRLYTAGPSDDDSQLCCSIDDGGSNMVLALPDRAYYVAQEFDTDTQREHAEISCVTYADGESREFYDVDGVYFSSLAVSEGKLYATATSNDGGSQRLMSIDVQTGDTATVYRSEDSEVFTLKAVSGGYAYLQKYPNGAYDATEWDLFRMPLSGEGDPEIIGENLDYYNGTIGVMNGHILVLENGQDVGSVGMRAAALSLEDCSVIDRYVS